MSSPVVHPRLRFCGRAAGSAVKWTGLLITGTAAGALLAGIILWDADFYKVRDRIEHFRLAMFGEWKDGRSKSVADIFDDVDSVSLFQNALVPELGTITTGARFTSSKAVVTDRPEARWCYVVIGHGVAATRVNLGDQDGEDPPEYADTAAIDSNTLSEIGVSAARLSRLARLHCRFS